MTDGRGQPPGGTPTGDRYPQLLRTPRYCWWRSLLGVAVAGVSLAGAASAVVLGVFVLTVLTGSVLDPLAPDALAPDTPAGLLANNLAIVMIIPAAMLAVFAVHRERVGWLASVVGRLRWGLLGRLLLLAFPVVVVFFAASFLIPPAGLGEVDPPGPATLAGLGAVILLTTPLQSAAEEVGFRGYLTQASAACYARPGIGATVAAVVTAVLFALAHGTQDPWLFADRMSFGLVASWLVWRTGGLEAGIALHVANNLVSLGWGAVAGSLDEAFSTTSLGWPYAVLDVAMMLVFAVFTDRFAGRWGVAVRRAPPPYRPMPGAPAGGVLSGPGGVGYPVQPSDTPPPAGGDKPWGMG